MGDIAGGSKFRNTGAEMSGPNACATRGTFWNVSILRLLRSDAWTWNVHADPMKENAMRALCWHGKGDVRVDTVPDPKIQHPRDAVIKITACAICGSDLHLLDDYQPTMESGDFSDMRIWAR
jgi:hypothetical protein